MKGVSKLRIAGLVLALLSGFSALKMERGPITD